MSYKSLVNLFNIINVTMSHSKKSNNNTLSASQGRTGAKLKANKLLVTTHIK